MTKYLLRASKTVALGHFGTLAPFVYDPVAAKMEEQSIMVLRVPDDLERGNKKLP